LFNFEEEDSYFGKHKDQHGTLYVVDSHTEGEPFRIIFNFPELIGKTILEKPAYARANFDKSRSMLMYEPRGHNDMYGGILVDPVNPSSDIGVLFIHNEGFSTMCGHGIIGLGTVLLQLGIFPLDKTILKIDTPAGTVTAYPNVVGKRVKSVRFHNVPSFLVGLDLVVEVPELGRKIKYDLAFGGGYYAYVQAKELGVECTHKGLKHLVTEAMKLKKAVMATQKLKHPFEKDLEFLYGVIVIDSPQSKENHSRNVTVFADGEVDRSSTGTGVSGRLVIHYARKEIALNQSINIESVVGTTFRGSVVKEVQFGEFDAIIPEVEGSSYYWPGSIYHG